MQYDFNKEIKNLAGDPLLDEKGKPVTAGKILANALVSGAKGDALKFWGWGQKLYNAQKIDLDKADQRTITEFVENSETITILAKGQILEILAATK